MPLFKFLPPVFTRVEFLKWVFNFNLSTNVPVLVRSCLLETPTPNWDALFTDCTLEFSNSRGSAGFRPLPTTISLSRDTVSYSRCWYFKMVCCFPNGTSLLLLHISQHCQMMTDHIVIFWPFLPLTFWKKNRPNK